MANESGTDPRAFEIQEQKEMPTSPTHGKAFFNKYVIGSAILASMNSVLLGYDIGVMSGAALFIKDNLKITAKQEEILIGSLNICSLIGSLASGRTSDCIGRRYTVTLASILFLLGALLMGFAPSYLVLMIGRVIAGIGVGYSLMIAPLYTAELSPAAMRGFFTSFPEIFITIGILLGYISNYAFASLPDNINWRIMVGIAAVPSIIIVLGVIPMPESPRWLMMRGRTEEAKQVLLKISSSEREAELRLIGITEGASADEAAAGGKGAWSELILNPSKPVRRMLIAAIGINFFMQASGNDAVIYYSPEVFKSAGIHNRKGLVAVTIAMGIAKTSFVIISACFLDRFGRRPLLLLGSIGMAVSLAGLGLGSKFLESSVQKPKWAVALCVLAVCADASFFSIGLGPITWVYSSEIFPTRLRAQASSIAVSVNRLVSGAVSMTFLTVSNAISFGYMLFIFAGVSTLAALFFYLYLPETKGKSLEEMEDLFDEKRREGISRNSESI